MILPSVLFIWRLLTLPLVFVVVFFIFTVQRNSQVSQVLFKNLLLNLNYRSFSIALSFHSMDDQIQKLQVKLRKLNPHESFLYLAWKYMILFLHFQLFPNVTRKAGTDVGNCWATYPKKTTQIYEKQSLYLNNLYWQ